jgi:hypothetical protein
MPGLRGEDKLWVIGFRFKQVRCKTHILEILGDGNAFRRRTGRRVRWCRVWEGKVIDGRRVC